MIEIKNWLNLAKNYGLLISDNDVVLVSWRRGEVERIALFGNDDTGVSRFIDYMRKNSAAYKNKPFHILTNLIGEDYRIEKVAHLIGKYKVDFHNRRMRQLFRGTIFTSSSVQGREERGRRDDIVLFYGLLSENKVLPWMNAIVRGAGGRYLAGIYPVSFVSEPVLKATGADWRQGNTLLMTLHEKGLLRQTFYSDGLVRFSRVSKVDDQNVENMVATVKKEIDRTSQHLTSLRISTSGGIKVQFVCPGSMIGQLSEMMESGEKVKYSFHDAGTVGQNMGLAASSGDIGRDSLLFLHSMFSYRRIGGQLAPFDYVRFYWLRFLSRAVIIVFGIYGTYGLSGALVTGYDFYRLSVGNQLLEQQSRELKSARDRESGVGGSGLSSSTNISAVSKTFGLLSKFEISPNQMVYYFAQAFAKNKFLVVNDMRWYLADSATSGSGSSDALFSGGDVFQILEVSGEFISIKGETYLDVAARAEKLLTSLSGRSDIGVEVIEIPPKSLSKEALSGTLEEGYVVDSARERTFRLRIVWKGYGADAVKEMAAEV